MPVTALCFRPVFFVFTVSFTMTAGIEKTDHLANPCSLGRGGWARVPPHRPSPFDPFLFAPREGGEMVGMLQPLHLPREICFVKLSLPCSFDLVSRRPLAAGSYLQECVFLVAFGDFPGSAAPSPPPFPHFSFSADFSMALVRAHFSFLRPHFRDTNAATLVHFVLSDVFGC